MSVIPTSGPLKSGPPASDLLPDISDIVIDDGKPVDNIYSERQMRLLVDSLYASWEMPGPEPFAALANVGLFISHKQPPVVPDVMVSLKVKVGGKDPKKKENLTYFVWIVGKLPEAVMEVVSNDEGGELDEKKIKYETMGVPYYIVWDPEQFLSEQKLHCFSWNQGKYHDTEPWFPLLQLGLTVWKGPYQGLDENWLRWQDPHGRILFSAEEKALAERTRANQESQRAEQERQRANQEHQRAEQESQLANQERQRADQERQRADALAAKLRALGVDPDQP